MFLFPVWFCNRCLLAFLCFCLFLLLGLYTHTVCQVFFHLSLSFPPPSASPSSFAPSFHLVIIHIQHKLLWLLLLLLLLL